jgi:hypothetical protein
LLLLSETPPGQKHICVGAIESTKVTFANTFKVLTLRGCNVSCCRWLLRRFEECCVMVTSLRPTHLLVELEEKKT